MTAPAPSLPPGLGTDLDARIAANAERAFDLLARLVAAPSTVGTEQGAQEVLAAELEDLGFEIERQPIVPDVETLPGAGIGPAEYEGRYNLVGRRPGDPALPSLLLNGHIDVVPATEADLWTSPPWEPTRRDGWLYGRGAGDMKCGFAMGVLAIRSLLEVAPAALAGRLAMVAAIEEECTGNGSLSASHQGVLADAVVLLEPTDLGLLLGGVGVLWLEVTVAGRAAHASVAGSAVNAIEAAVPLLAALRAFERELNETVPDPRISGTRHPFELNIGRFVSGDWASSVPAVARFEIRVGFPLGWTAADAEARVRACISAAAEQDPWLRANPPGIRASGFRAEGYDLAADAPLARRMATAHREAHGTDPRGYVIGSTTDARIYLNRQGIPALCYGPRTTAIHGVDEGVELASIVDGARTLARFLAGYLGPSGETA